LEIATRLLGKVQVRGKTEVISVYEVLDADEDQVRLIKEATKAEFEAGVSYYQRGEFAHANQNFTTVHQLNPSDKMAELYKDSIIRQQK